ncbi:MAG: CapA family protein [Candidatus Symbiothrix sp.]|jgi:poly-gamma-glutamate synthesis protein (capsule biosynthesis protein)|nr:CapA family protein [Candidatus Symbiothrix sp.]
MARLFCLFIGLYAVGSISPAMAQKLTLLFAGDAMQHQSQIDNAYRDGKFDYSSYFQPVSYEISQADIAVVNLEVTLGGKPYKGYPMFSAPDEYAVALKDAGFDVFLNANNHILDRFSKGLHRTLDVLDSLEVKHTGVFRNAAEREETYPLMIDKNGIRLAFLNYTYATNGIKAAFPDYVNYIDKLQIQKDIQKAKELKADIIIANMHWGEEYHLIQNKTQENLAQFLMDEGVDMVMGSHPHVVQPSRAVTDSIGNITNLVIYSLGNFVSSMTAVNTDGGQMIRVVLYKNPDKTAITSCGYILHYTERKKNGNKTDFSVVPVWSAERDSISPNNLKMKRFATNARAIFDKYNEGIPEYRILTPPPPEEDYLKFLPIKFVR